MIKHVKPGWVIATRYNNNGMWNYSEDILELVSPETWPISTKLGIKYPLVKGIQIYLNERSHPFPVGDNSNFKQITCINLSW